MPPITTVDSKYGAPYAIVNPPVLTNGVEAGVTPPGIASVTIVRVLTGGLKLKGGGGISPS